jgi:ferredoxin
VEITVDIPACVGAGQCVLVAEELFDQDADGIVVLLDASPPDSLRATARRAAALCPARAIQVSE